MSKQHPKRLAGDEIHRISRRLIGENTVFKLYFDHLLDKHGDEVTDYLVVAPKLTSAEMITGIAILPITDQQIGLIRIYRPAIGCWTWEIPHGFIEADESVLSAATRELLEETGLASVRLVPLGYITPDSGVLAAKVQLFAAMGCRYIAPAEKEMGVRELTLFSVETFEQMIWDSVITDSFTLAAWCRYRLLPTPLAGMATVSSGEDS